MRILDWLFHEERDWVIFNMKKSAYFIVDSGTANVYTHNIDMATKFNKREAKRLAWDLDFVYHTYIQVK